MVKEIAKPFNSSVSEVERTVQYILDTITEYNKMKTEHLVLGKNKKADIILKPLGVILVISPFNYPINLSMTKLAPALLTGNTVVFKSATNGTLTSSRMIELAHQAGFPKGVINFVTGQGSVIGDCLIHNNKGNAIMFTGGTTTGLKIAKDSTMKYLMFELGGKDPAIVCKDADLEIATDKIITGAFSYSGQRCTAIKRVFVHKDIKSDFLKLLTEKTNKLTVGEAKNNCDITALIQNKAATFVQALLDDALEHGAVSLTKVKRQNNLV
jgi:glyceraldehyde-3-phosphate dehydrogenase (NADP+)